MFLLVIALSVSSLGSSNAGPNGNEFCKRPLPATGTDQDLFDKFKTKQMYAGKIEGGMYEKFSGKNIPVRPKLLWYLDC